MIRYVSTKGGTDPVNFDDAILAGFAADGGLFVPERIPLIKAETLNSWRGLGYTDLAFNILSLYIDKTIIPADHLKNMIRKSYETFESPEVIPLVKFNNEENMYIMELFRGPTLSFKDVAMGLLMNLLDYLLKKRDLRLSILLATTGDTGPAAARAAAGKKHIDCYPIFPLGMISLEQQRQMTSVQADNIHPIGVLNCKDGGDDIDKVVARMIGDPKLSKKFSLSTVNSINWCRIMIQSVHYFYAYLQTVKAPHGKVAFSVPSGAFGNLFAGTLAREMGLPVERFICATNNNQTLHMAISQGKFLKKDLIETFSSAMDIVVPYNFWRYLYFSCGKNGAKIKLWMEEFKNTGQLNLDSQTHHNIKRGIDSLSVNDSITARTIQQSFNTPGGYLLDPHTAVAVSAALELRNKLPNNCPLVCMATAHPAKFPELMKRILGFKDKLPPEARHQSIENDRNTKENLISCKYSALESTLVKQMSAWFKKGRPTSQPAIKI